MCTYGITCRGILQTYADYDPSAFKQHAARFSSPVYPGETVTMELWKDGNVISFEAKVKARGVHRDQERQDGAGLIVACPDAAQRVSGALLKPGPMLVSVNGSRLCGRSVKDAAPRPGHETQGEKPPWDYWTARLR